jgi:hypothetical protein
MINFCHKFHITLGHSTAYYPQGNGLAESSNKSLINIIKKVLRRKQEELAQKAGKCPMGRQTFKQEDPLG